MKDGMREVRRFIWSDVPLLRRLSPLGVSLDTVTGLTRGIRPINDALLASLPLGDLGMPTYVLRDGNAGVLGQLRHRVRASHAYLAYLAPDLAKSADTTLWLNMVEGLTLAAGRRGAHALNAEVDPNSEAFVALREAGFAVFARQDLWRRPPAPVSPFPARLLRPRLELDAVGITTLYSNTVPRLVQQATPPPQADGKGLVYVNEDGQLAGYFVSFEGPHGVLLRPFMHPEVYEQVAGLIADGLTYLPHAARVPVYCAVQRYQDWLRDPLAEAGFEPWARQVVMVKYTVRQVKHAAFQPLPSLERAPPVVEMKIADPTAPLSSQSAQGDI
jgi:hypothetical protein